jgi:hypothetical protein
MIVTPWTSAQTCDDFGLTYSEDLYLGRLNTTPTAFTVPEKFNRCYAVLTAGRADEMLIGLNQAPINFPGTGDPFEQTDTEFLNGRGSICRLLNGGDVLNVRARSGTFVFGISFYPEDWGALPPRNDSGFPFPSMVFSGVVTSTNKTVVVPDDEEYYYVLFRCSSTNDAYIALDAEPDIPSGAFTTINSELINGNQTVCRRIPNGS